VGKKVTIELKNDLKITVRVHVCCALVTLFCEACCVTWFCVDVQERNEKKGDQEKKRTKKKEKKEKEEQEKKKKKRIRMTKRGYEEEEREDKYEF
jgi:hypothetical protein